MQVSTLDPQDGQSRLLNFRAAGCQELGVAVVRTDWAIPGVPNTSKYFFKNHYTSLKKIEYLCS